jgi:hypothetical protein
MEMTNKDKIGVKMVAGKWCVTYGQEIAFSADVKSVADAVANTYKSAINKHGVAYA